MTLLRPACGRKILRRGRVQLVDKILRCAVWCGLRDTISIAVVNDRQPAFLDEVVLEIVRVCQPAGSRRVPVCVVGAAGRKWKVLFWLALLAALLLLILWFLK